MMSYDHDLVTQLRAARPGYPPGELCMRAADEIELLIEGIAALNGYADECTTKIKMLTDQIDEMVDAAIYN